MASANPHQQQPPDPGISSNPVLEQEIHRAREAITIYQQRITAVQNDIDVVRTQSNATFVFHEKHPALQQLRTAEYDRRKHQFDSTREAILRSLRAEAEAPIQLRPVSYAQVEHASNEHLREMFYSSPKVQCLIQRARDYGIIDKYGHRHPGDTSTMRCLLSPDQPSHNSETEVEAAFNRLLVKSSLKKFLAIGICTLEPREYYNNHISHFGPKNTINTYDGKEKLPSLTYDTADDEFKAACDLIWNCGHQIPVLRFDDQKQMVEDTVPSSPFVYDHWFHNDSPISIAQVITFTNVEGDYLIFDIARSSAPRRAILRVLGDSSIIKIIADTDDIEISLPTTLLTPRSRLDQYSIFTLDTHFNKQVVPNVNTASTYLQLVRRLRQLPAPSYGTTLTRTADTYFHGAGYRIYDGRPILRLDSYYGVPNENGITVLEPNGPGYEISKMRALMAMDVTMALMSSDARTLTTPALTNIARDVREVSSKLLTPSSIIPFAQEDRPLPPSNWLCRFNQPCMDPFLEKFGSEGDYRTRVDALRADKTRLEQQLAEWKTALQSAVDRLSEWQNAARKRKNPTFDDIDMESSSPLSRPRTDSTSTSSHSDPRRRSHSQSSRRHTPSTRASPPPDPNRYRRINTDLPSLNPQSRTVSMQQQVPAPPRITTAQPTIPLAASKSSSSILSMKKVDREAAAKEELARKFASVTVSQSDDRTRQAPSHTTSAASSLLVPPGRSTDSSTAPKASSTIKQTKHKIKPTDPMPTNSDQLAQWFAVCRQTWPPVFHERGKLNDHDINELMGIDWTRFKGLPNAMPPFTRIDQPRTYIPYPQIDLLPAQYKDHIPPRSNAAICLKNWKIAYRNVYDWLCKTRPFACSPVLYSALACEAILFAENACIRWFTIHPQDGVITSSLLLEFYLFVTRSCVMPIWEEHCALRGETTSGETPHPNSVRASVVFSNDTSRLCFVHHQFWLNPISYMPEPFNDNDTRYQQFMTLQAAVPANQAPTPFSTRITIPYLLDRILDHVYTQPPFSGDFDNQPFIGSMYTPPGLVRNTFAVRDQSAQFESTSMSEVLSLQTRATSAFDSSRDESVTLHTDSDATTRLSASGFTDSNMTISPINYNTRSTSLERVEDFITASSALEQHLSDAMTICEQTPSTVTRNIYIGDTFTEVSTVNEVTGEILELSVQPIPPADHPQIQLKEGDGIMVDDEKNINQVPRASNNDEESINEEEILGHSSDYSDEEESDQPSPARFKSHSSSKEQQQQPRQRKQRVSVTTSQKKKSPGSGSKRRSSRR